MGVTFYVLRRGLWKYISPISKGVGGPHEANKCHYTCKIPNTSIFFTIGITTSSTYQIIENNDISTAIPKITSITTATNSSTITGYSISTVIWVITIISAMINLLISLLLLLLLSLLFKLSS